MTLPDTTISDEAVAAARAVKKLHHVNADEWMRAAIVAALVIVDQDRARAARERERARRLREIVRDYEM